MSSNNQSIHHGLKKWITLTLVLLLSRYFQVASASIPRNKTHFIPQKRIVGGAEARWEYQRHLAYLELVTKKGHFYPCAGTVIGRRWILTTAHCVQPTKRIKYTDLSASNVYIGSKSAYPQFTMTPYTIKSVYIHKHWKPSSNDFRNDIALIMLRKLIDRPSYAPIQIGHAPPPKSVVTAVGYGSTSEQGGMPSKLMQANLVAQEFQTCASRERLPLRKFLRDNVQVCATSLGFPHRATTDTCYGDSGGPLFTKKNGKSFQYAMTSFASSKCAEVRGTPWYVRVSHYKTMLQNIMWKSGDKNFRKFDIVQRPRKEKVSVVFQMLR